MSISSLLNLSLLFHIIGLVLVGGSNVVRYVLQGQFWQQYEQSNEKGMAVMKASSRLQRVIGIGFVIILLSGISLVSLTHGAYAGQFWFRVKMAALLGIIVNGLAFGRKNDHQLQKLVTESGGGNDHATGLGSVRTRMNIFYLIQLVFFITILTLSVFKFS